jgi:hypothetical protein
MIRNFYTISNTIELWLYDQCYLLKDFYLLRLLNPHCFRNKNVYLILSEELGVTGFMNTEISGHMC